MLTTLLSLLMAGIASDGIKTEFMASGATAKAGGYRPIRAELTSDASLVKAAPEGLSAPRYGKLEFDGKTWAFILDEPAEGDARLFVDTNGDGDLTNDPAATWTKGDGSNATWYSGTAEIDLTSDRRGALGLYRFNPEDPQRAQLKDTLLYYADFGTQVTITLDGKEYPSFLAGAPSERSAFWLDRDGNGKRSSKREMAVVGRPFNFTGTTYVINFNEGDLSLDKASEPLPMTPLPPDLSIGQMAIPFSAKTTEGSEVNFPQSYEGKVVMIDFWATWCGPCIGEIPHMKEAYAKYHDQGFEILGISFDRPDMAEKLEEFRTEKELPWPQVYEGKYWDTTIGEMYDVGAIPFVLLVDGSTGEILATARELRGPGLTDFIGAVIEKRTKNDK